MPVHGGHLARLQGEVPDTLGVILVYEVGPHEPVHLALDPMGGGAGSGWAGRQAGRYLAGGGAGSCTEGAGGLAGSVP